MRNTESIWSKTTEIHKRPSFFPEKSTSGAARSTIEAVVIGAGMAGILTAYFLQKKGVEVIVLEADRIGSGQTKNTTAKITSQHNLIYDKLLKTLGEEKAHQYAAANQRAIGEYRRIIRELEIECDFEQLPSYLYSKIAEPLLQEAEAACKLGIDAKFVTDTGLPFDVKSALKFDGQAQFHPLKFMEAISKDLVIYENTRVLTVANHQITISCSDQFNSESILHNIYAEHIVFATHFPFLNVPGYYFMRMHQERSYVIALENAMKLDGMYLGIDAEGLSFRNSGDLLLLGGGNHRVGENSAGGQFDFLKRNAASFWPESREVACWSAQDCMTVDEIPFIGRFSEATPNWYIATGFNKWGMSSSMSSAMILSDLVVNGNSPYEEVFSPNRLNFSLSVKKMIDDGLQSFKGISKEFLSPPKEQIESLGFGQGGIVEYDGQKVGVYKDEKGVSYIVSPKCPHLGCQLEWNPDELSWDCPCHGSRFNYMGAKLNGPAQEGLPSTTIIKQEDLPDV